ncbi:MAG: DUF3788 family protein [Chloroflexi bacterium]|nr:DUF3788 family protein [Chloroflexota bacterium]
MSHERLLDKNDTPTLDSMEKHVGARSNLWRKVHKYIQDKYDYLPEVIYFTKDNGWTIRYRRNGKTLCYLFPERNSFSALIVLGKSEVEKVEAHKNDLNPKMLDIFNNTEQLHDGRWLWIKELEVDDLASLKVLLTAKKKPKERET